MPTPPLILNLIPTLARGGAERIAVELAARLPGEGFKTKLVALFDGGRSQKIFANAMFGGRRFSRRRRA
jgi:hypothetical protein